MRNRRVMELLFEGKPEVEMPEREIEIDKETWAAITKIAAFLL